MKLGWLLGTVGLCAGLAGQPARAADPFGLTSLPFEVQQPPAVTPQPPTPTPPRPAPPTTPPPRPVPPAPAPLPPGQPTPTAPSPLTQAPVTDFAAQTPQTATTAAPSLVPFMIGDQLSGSLALRGGTPTPGNGNGVNGRFSPGLAAAVEQAGRGAFKIIENESPRPLDRVFINYNYFNGVGRGVPNVPIFDIHRQTFGFEKTFFGGDASIGLRMSTIQSTGDGSLSASDFGATTVISKFAWVNDRQTGNVFTTGLAVTAPTGQDTILLDGSRLNPTLIQPYSGFIYNFERLYFHGFSALIIPTDDRDVLLATNSLGAGYFLFRAPNPADSAVSFVIPTVEAHLTNPLNHRGLDSGDLVGFPDLLVITSGLHTGLGARSILTVGIAVPVTGPKLFDLEAFAQLNFRF